MLRDRESIIIAKPHLRSPRVLIHIYVNTFGLCVHISTRTLYCCLSGTNCGDSARNVSSQKWLASSWPVLDISSILLTKLVFSTYCRVTHPQYSDTTKSSQVGLGFNPTQSFHGFTFHNDCVNPFSRIFLEELLDPEACLAEVISNRLLLAMARASTNSCMRPVSIKSFRRSEFSSAISADICMHSMRKSRVKTLPANCRDTI
jgi:hypothetical protein